MKHSLDKIALDYHEFPNPGKLEIRLTKPAITQQDLALAYSPGVAAPVRAIASDPQAAYRYTAKGNLVAVISNGTAILGLGNLGPLASKPVMEGKAILFKLLANIDVFDIEVGTEDPKAFIETVANISPTFGGINLEDIKAPECFEIEDALKARLNIPVFHDDQHGTAVIVAAGLLNALILQKKDISEVNIVCLGAGAAGIASMNLLLSLGAKRDNIIMLDTAGVIHADRPNLNRYKQAFARTTDKRTLADAMHDTDVFIGLSGPNLVEPEMLLTMRANPVIFALSNPDPEITPVLAKSIRKDLIIATGRSDFPNQVNNVLCFPYLFRGALNVRAHCINEAMLIAAVNAIRSIVHEPIPAEIKAAYPDAANLSFSADYILPKPTDPRLLQRVSTAVAQAAIASGAAPTADSINLCCEATQQ
jgi:malate dehydrogenase (oxaloacetate-decarboxylating)/malate dehydrogenase (oxaloacetate-decarboxylating)(NADP+)